LSTFERIGRIAGLVSTITLLLSFYLPLQGKAQEPEFIDRPTAPSHWTYGRRLDEAQLRYCVDSRDPDWEIAAEIADTIASGLLLEPIRHVVESEMVLEDITKVYEIMLKHCDMHMGFKLIAEGYSDWATLTRSYYKSEYVFVTLDPELDSLEDLDSSRPIGATMGTMAHLRLVSYLQALPREDRWPTFPMSSNELALNSLVKGTIDVALIWAPNLWAKQRKDSAFPNVRILKPSPLPSTSLGVGGLMLSNQIFLRTAVDEAISALTADGTIPAILQKNGFPASAEP
jgi:polar amino acid transport system substrate-binding protein